jgi:small subunit ribosomal protein S16
VSVSIKLSRGGVPGKPIYRIVASTRGTKRDGKFLEVLGQYNPNTNPSSFKLVEDKVKKWIEQGAQPTLIVRNLIKKQMPGLLEKRAEHSVKKTQALRKARKARGKAAAPKAEKPAKKASPKAKAKNAA